MAELYWITVIGNLNTTSFFVLGCSLIALIISIIMYCETSYSEEIKVLSIKGIKKSSICIFISAILLVFGPSQRQLYVIYGIGSTIEYIQDNPKAKQLPKAAVEALNKYLESINGQDRNSESN